MEKVATDGRRGRVHAAGSRAQSEAASARGGRGSRDGRPGRSPVPAVGSRPTGRVRVPELMVGLLLVAGGALTAVVWHTRSTATRDVVVAARPIARGAVVAAADLRTVGVAGDSLPLLDGEQASALVGRVAVVDLAVGVPLTEAMVVEARPLADGEALTAVAIEPGWAPSDLAAGDAVRVVTVVPDADALGDIAALFPGEISVWDVAPTDGTSQTVITLRGPLDLATELAQASSVRIARVAS